MKPKKIPMRMCVGCRESKPKRELIRVVRAPDGTVSMDPGGKKLYTPDTSIPDEEVPAGDASLPALSNAQ